MLRGLGFSSGFGVQGSGLGFILEFRVYFGAAGDLNKPWVLLFIGSKALTQRVHIHYHYGIRSQKAIPIMVLGA